MPVLSRESWLAAIRAAEAAVGHLKQGDHLNPSFKLMRWVFIDNLNKKIRHYKEKLNGL